jgi:hypothetical protein
MAVSDILAKWGPVFDRIAPKYGLDPDILKAIALQENVKPAYNNPLGRSSETGVYKYSPDQAEAMIEHQVQTLTNPNGYYKDFVKSGSIDDLAKVYSPVGAKNDVYGTNSTEASGIQGFLAKIKGGNLTPSSNRIVAAGTGTTTVPSLPGTPVQPALAPATGIASTTDPATLAKIQEMNTLISMQNQQNQQQVAPGIGSGPAIGSLLSSIYKGGQEAGWWKPPRAQLVKNPTA